MDDQHLKNLPSSKFDEHKMLKIHDFFSETRKLLFEKMFTIEIKDGPEAPLQPSYEIF